MGIVTGYICLILLLLLLQKFSARKFKWNKINNALAKGHKYIAFSFLAVSIIHFILVLRVLEGRHILVTISGIVILIAGILLTVVCHVVKNQSVKVDAVSRATNSSKVIMKACENALSEK